MIYVYTSSALNYLPKVRILFDSLKKYHPEFKLNLMLVDKLPKGFDYSIINADEIITIPDLDIPEWKSWIFSYSLIELCTAVKPFALKYLLQKSECDCVLYFDPDIVLFSRIDDLLEEFKTYSILLTPHQTIPEQTLEAIKDNEICSLRHGIYNLGFIGVKSDKTGFSFAEWWSERLYHFCFADREKGFWVDQKWIDFVPVFFDNVKIIKCSRFNVAPWNITNRKLEGDFQRGFTVDNKPLGFYHFTGFDSGDHVIMATKYAGQNKAIRTLIKWYSNLISKNLPYSKNPWGYATFTNGDTITSLHRFIYRGRKDLKTAYPDPFEVKEGENCYYNWFIWRASIEYPELVNTLQNINNNPKIQPSYSKIMLVKIFCRYFIKGVKKPSYGFAIFKQAFKTFFNEGYHGLKKRIGYT